MSLAVKASVARTGALSDGVSGSLETLWALPGLPFTEMFGSYDASFPAVDQELLIDDLTGHVQLRNFVDPGFLYRPTNYALRTLSTSKVEAELNLLSDFIDRNLVQRGNGLTGLEILEFGANNLALAQKLLPRSTNFFAVDPILAGQGDDAPSPITVYPGMIEDFLSELSTPLDLIVARHTLEHIAEPLVLMRALREKLKTRGIVVVEVPDWDAIVTKLRFDAVFHQHYQYYDVSSLETLAARSGLKVVAIERNPRGSNGGSLLAAFQAGDGPEPKVDVAVKRERVRQAILRHAKMFEVMSDCMDAFGGPVAVFGAGLMLPTLDHHLGGRLGSIGTVFDDDPDKEGISYRNLPLKVASAPRTLDGTLTVVGSLENVRAITRRCYELGAGVVVAPAVT